MLTILLEYNSHFGGLYVLPRVHNISREGECLTAYTYFKCNASSTESTPLGVN